MTLEVSAENIHKAVTGLGTNDEQLVTSITNHTKEELLKIAEIYERSYKEPLVRAIKGDTSGNYKDILVALVTPRTDFQVNQIYDAVRGLGTNEKALVDILAHAANEEIELIKAFYAAKHKKNLDDAIKSDTSGFFQKALLALLQASRNARDETNPAASAEHLFKAVEKKEKESDNVSNLIAFLVKASFSHIYATDEAYKQHYGHSILEVIVKETSGDLQDLLKALITKPEVYWAQRIHEAMKGLGTDNKVLVRAFALNDREQLSKIGNEYVAKYGETLQKAVEHDTSGWYRTTLVSLLNYSGHY